MSNDLDNLNEIKIDAVQYEECRKKLHEIERNDCIRMIASAELLIDNFFYASASIYDIRIPITLILLCSILFWIIFFIMSEKPELWYVIAVLLLIGVISRCISIQNIVLLSLTLYWSIRDNQDRQWLKNQPGYPAFSAFLAEQKLNADKEYQPKYQFDHIHEAEMPEISIVNLSKVSADTSKSVVMPDVDDL